VGRGEALTLTLDNRPGTLAGVAEKLAQARVTSKVCLRDDPRERAGPRRADRVQSRQGERRTQPVVDRRLAENVYGRGGERAA
jgi:hypothetical protein